MRIFGIESDSAFSADAQVAARPSAWRRVPVRVRDRFFPALAYPAYASLWRANSGSMSAFSMQTMAQGWLVVSITGSPMMLGVLGLFQAVPMILLSPIGGLLADRLDRGRVIQVSQLMVLIGALAIGALVVLNWIEMWHLIVFSTIVGASFASSVPSRHAMVADLVPRSIVPNAVALNNATLSTANFIGPALAGFLVGAFGVASAYFGQVGAYAWSIVNVAHIGPSRAVRGESASMFRTVRDGFNYVLHQNPSARLCCSRCPPRCLDGL